MLICAKMFQDWLLLHVDDDLYVVCGGERCGLGHAHINVMVFLWSIVNKVRFETRPQ